MKPTLSVMVAVVALSLTLFAASAEAENVLIYRNRVDSPNLTVAKGATVTWVDLSQLNAQVEFPSGTKGVLLQATKVGLRATFTEPGVYEYTVHLSPETSMPHQLQGKVTVR